MSRNEQQYELFLKLAQFTRFLVDESLADLIQQDDDEAHVDKVVDECESLASSLRTLVQKSKENTMKTRLSASEINRITLSDQSSRRGQQDLIWLNFLTIIESFRGRPPNSCEIYAYCGLCNTTKLRVFEWNCHYASDEHRRRLRRVTSTGEVLKETQCKTCKLVVFSGEEQSSRVFKSKEHVQLDKKLSDAVQGNGTESDDDTNDENLVETASAPSHRPKKAHHFINRKKSYNLSHGKSLESLRSNQSESRDPNKSGSYYVIDNEKIYLTTQFELICKEMLTSNTPFYYCRPCWFSTSDKQKWALHCSNVTPRHMRSTSKHANYLGTCKVCGLQLIASHKIPEAFMKYHLRVNHKFVEEEEYSDCYKMRRVE